MTEQREQPQSFQQVIPFIKFWVVFMGFFQCGLVSFTGRTTILGADVQKRKKIRINTGIQKHLSMFSCGEVETLHGTEAWRYHVLVCGKWAKGWSIIDHGDTDSPETLPMMFLRKSFTNIGVFFFLLQNCLALQSMWMVYGIEQNSSLLHSLSLFRFWFSLLTMVLT